MESAETRKNDPAVSIAGLSFSYHSEPVLSDVDIQINAGEMVFIVGPNGGGKTTLLRLILGLLTPDRGAVRVFGHPPEQMRSCFGYVPQHVRFDDKFPVSVMDVVLMGRTGSPGLGFYSRHDRKAAEQALEEVGMLGLSRRGFSSLSGGQRQRVLVARAMSIQPEILMLDEPTAHVDSMAVEEFYNLLERLNERLTILNVSHDLGVVSRMASSVICVNRSAVIRPLSEMNDTVITDIWGQSASVMRHNGDRCPIHTAGNAHE